MLSKESEQFIIELRMYLISKGKSDKQINEITEELEDHLLQAEKAGKSIAHITGESPKQYIKSISKELDTDFRQLIALAPLIVLILMAFFSISPAIEGTFSLSKTGMWGAIIGTVLSLLVYGFLLLNVLPKLFHSKWFYGVAIGAYVLVTGIFAVAYFLDLKQGSDPFFVATPLQNNLILIGCVIIFIASAVYMKSWLLILAPIVITVYPIGSRLIPDSINKDPKFIALTIIALVIISVVVILFLIQKNKRSDAK